MYIILCNSQAFYLRTSSWLRFEMGSFSGIISYEIVLQDTTLRPLDCWIWPRTRHSQLRLEFSAIQGFHMFCSVLWWIFRKRFVNGVSILQKLMTLGVWLTALAQCLLYLQTQQLNEFHANCLDRHCCEDRDCRALPCGLGNEPRHDIWGRAQCRLFPFSWIRNCKLQSPTKKDQIKKTMD